MLCNWIFSKEFLTGKNEFGSEEVPIIHFKDRGRIIYQNNRPLDKYKQNYKICWCFGIFASDFAAIGDFYAEEALSDRIEELLQFEIIENRKIFNFLVMWCYIINMCAEM